MKLQRVPVAKAEMLIRKPVAEVFEAFVNPAVTTKFWFTKSSGRLETGKQVQWDWEMFGHSIQVSVKAIEENKRILIEWPGHGRPSVVEWLFTPRADNTTFVSVTNSGFSGDGDEIVKQEQNGREQKTKINAEERHSSESATHAAIEAIARNSYGRLIAYLAARSGDVAGAEDALSHAFVAALERWPADGVPEKPEAWLLHVARNRIIDDARHNQVRENAEPFLQQIAEEAQNVAATHDHFPDERLKLLFVCAHPAIEVAARTPLMLQTVLGIDAARVASAFLVSPAAMSQRLVRAKNKIRDAAIPFRVPDPPEWNERVSFVLDAIYSAYTTGWENLMEVSSTHHALAEEAIAIGRALAQLMPDEPEVHGLLALMLHCEARRAARYTGNGEFVPLDQQDTALWSRPMINEAEKHLRAAATFKRMGRYQLEAAIQSIHASRAVSGRIDWSEIALLYEGLVQIAPGIGSLVGRAVAMSQAGKPAAGLAALEEIPTNRVVNYQPYWAARGHLLQLLDRRDEAQQAFTRAASLTDDPALREHLFKRAANSAQMSQVAR